jgi:membrane protein DedA with SNARE-associated domain
LPLWHVLFKQHIYASVLVATTLEGLGLPLPAEVLFLAAGVVIAQGGASLTGVILAAVCGNVLGSLVGFTLAYLGGKVLLGRVTKLVGIKEESMRRVERFFGRYGALTVFLSRFIGFIRAATIYSAGAARMAPLRFGIYLLAATLIWNTAWMLLAYRFGQALPGLIHRVLAHGIVWVITVLAAFLVIRLVLTWYRGRRAAS